MIFTTDPYGHISYICVEWTQYTGQSRTDVYAYEWVTPILPKDRDTVARTLAQAAQARAEFSIRFRVKHTDGSIRWLAAGGVPSFGPPGRSFLGFLGSMTEFAPTAAPEMTSYGKIERFIPPPTHHATRAQSPLDTIADHLLIAHALMEQHKQPFGLQGVKTALREVGCALASGEGSQVRLN